jgi:hypothetical protein
VSPPRGHWARLCALRLDQSVDLGLALRAWPGAADSVLSPRLWAAVGASEPQPSTRELGAWLGSPLVPPPAPDLSPAEVLEFARQHAPSVEPSPAAVLRWKLNQIAWYGGLRGQYEARGALDLPSTPDTVADQDARACWTALFEGRPWDEHARWEGRYLPVAMGVFSALLAARQVPPAVRQRTLRDLREAFFLQLQLGEPPLWLDLAARVVQTRGSDEGLPQVVGPEGYEALLRCAARRGRWADTIARLWPELLDPRARAQAGLQCAAPLRHWVDAHLLMRLVAAWEEEPSGDHWQRLAHNRGRSWARVRALAADKHRPELAAQVLALDHLDHRTAVALRQLAWGWAWRELAANFTFDDDRGGPPRCIPATLSPRALDSDERAALRTWVLLCLLRGRWHHLRQWVREGRTGDRDSTWGRLLAVDLPPAQRDEGLLVLRERLVDDLADAVDAWQPLLVHISALRLGRDLAQRVRLLLLPHWSAVVPLPRGGAPAIVRNAQKLLVELRTD